MTLSPMRWLALLLLVPDIAVAGDGGPISRDLNEKVEMISVGSGLGRIELETTIYSPPGSGPFPLVVINHGKAFGNPKFDPRARYPAASREFLKRGYMVALPMRRGYANSGGVTIDAGCNTESNARTQADDILDVLAKLLERPEVDKDRVLLIGQSYGGIASIAAGSRVPQGVRGILNFAGGIKRSEMGCTWEKSMVDAFASFGREARVPSLWFYGDNDSYWGPELPRKAVEAFQAAGGNARLISYGVFDGGDAHQMFGSSRGLKLWWPETEAFLKAVGLPVGVQFEIELARRPARTGYAALADLGKVPYLDDKRRELYRKFLAMPYPRAFAIAATGNVGWAYGGADPLSSALSNCEKAAKTACSLYAVDDDVVWQMTEERK